MRNRYLFLLLLTLSYTSSSVHSQDAFTDSLVNLLPSQETVEKAETYAKLAAYYLSDRTNPELSKDFGIKALEIYNELDSHKGIYKASRTTGYAFMFMSEYNKALEYYLQTLEAAELLGDEKKIVSANYYIGQAYDFLEEYASAIDYYQKVVEESTVLQDTSLLAKSYYGLGNIYLTTMRYEESMEYYQKGLRLTEKYPKYNDLTNSLYNGIGSVYYEWGDYEVALDYYRKSRDLNLEIDNNYSLAYSYNNIGRVYYQWEAYDEALRYYTLADSLFGTMGYTTGQSYAVFNIGLIYEKSGDRSRAIKNYRRAIIINKSIGAKRTLVDTYGGISEFYLNDARYDSALHYAELMLPLAEEVDYQQGIINSYLFCSRAYEKIGDYKQSLKFNKKYIDLKDKYFSAEVEEKVKLTAMIFEHEKAVEARVLALKRENEIKETRIRQSRIFMIGMGGFILLLVVTAVLLFRNYRLLQIQKQLLLEQRLLRSQMNPHFIFNALASIQGFMFKKDTLKAGKYLSNFSKLIRNILEGSREDVITLEKEISTITNYLELQKLRYGDKFDYKIDIDKDLDTEEIQIPPMLVQPFIENAIEHGIKNKEGSGIIDVKFSRKDDRVVFEVEDDGVGRQKAKEIALIKGKKHVSLATKITNERIESLSKKLRRKIHLHIEDLKDEEDNPAGTRIVLEMPVIEE